MVERQRQIKYKEKILLTNAHKRARLKGLEINIDIDDIIIPNICPVLGIPIYRDAALNSHSCPSLDRIDNSKGYVKGNVQVVSFRANAIKRDATIDELKRIIEYIEKFTIIS